MARVCQADELRLDSWRTPWTVALVLTVTGFVTGDVTLTGRVDTRESKWLAEEIARAVPGVVDLHNRIKVARL